MTGYEGALQGMNGQEPKAFSRRARAIILKYSMLVDHPLDESGNRKTTLPTEHRDLRQALHLIDTTLQSTQGNPAYAALREWMFYRKVRILADYDPEMVGETIALMEKEFPASHLLDDVLAEQIFSEGVVMANVDAAKATFAELLKRYPHGNAVDNAYSWMEITLRCAGRVDEARKINDEIIRLFPLTRHAQYARLRNADPSRYLNGCGDYQPQ